MKIETVGLVGLGAMGSAMARHVIASGRQVLGWDRNAEACEGLRAIGGTPTAVLAGVAAAPVVISMVFDDEAVRDVTWRAGGLAEAMRPGAIHVVMATISPATARAIHDAHVARGQRCLIASVFGRPEAAAAARLSINCSGPDAVFEEAAPVLATLGEARLIGSEPEQAMLLKLMGNNMIYAAATMVFEMYSLLRAGGIADVHAKEMIIDKLFPGQIFGGYAARFLDKPLTRERHPIAVKDNQLCLEAAAVLEVDLPMVRFINDQWNGQPEP